MNFPVRSLFIAIFVFAFTDSCAQSVRYGIVAGLQLSHPKHIDSRLGFNLGMKGELGFSDNESKAYLDFGLQLSAKGWKEKLFYADLNENTEWKCRLYYLEVPIHAGYKYAVGERIKLLADIGPYFAVGLSGKSEFDSGDNALDSENPYEGNLFKNDTYKRLDIGIGAKTGIEVNKKLQLTIGYEMSLINPTDERWRILSLKDRTLGLSMAYMF